MPKIPIIMPQLGESIAEATIVALPFKIGDAVDSDQDVIEVETNKATMGVTTPCRGIVSELLVELQQSYPVGATLAFLEVDEAEAARLGLDTSPSLEPETHLHPEGNGSHPVAHPETRSPKTPPGGVEPTVRGLPVPAHAAGASYLSPRMKARMAELGIHAADMAGVAGSGGAGRVTVEDFEKFVASLDEHKLSPASSMRVAVADAMRRSWTRPLATVGMSVKIDRLLAHRRGSAIKAGPALYALRALAVALGENSAPAGRLIGGKIVHPRAIDVGFAVEAEDGVLVPVLRGVDHTPLAELVGRYNDLVELARQRRLPPSATGGSIATITNFGTFGLEWATPIPLPEQTLVLGMGAGRLMPNWDAETKQFLPVMEAQFTLSFDHRVLDGGAAGRLLSRIAALLQSPETL